MLCERCKKNVATTHIRSVINGKKTEKHLCSECAASEGMSIYDTDLSGMLSTMFGDVLSLNPKSAQVRCQCCGSTFGDIASTGKAGCPDCYRTFYNEFLPYLNRVHGSVKHIGKTLAVADKPAQKQEDEITTLKRELSNLVREEKFEQAAQVRDRIKRLEAEQ